MTIMLVGKLLLFLLVAAMAADGTRVTHLKGFDGPLPFSMETGYVEVEETHGVELFYYFIESESESELARQLRVFLQKWMARHPELASNPLYIAGDSYSGYTVTVTALEVANHPVSDGDGDGDQQPLNLKGYMVGNARGEVNYDNSGKLPFLHGKGLISDELSSCTTTTTSRKNKCWQARQAISEATSDVNPMHILEPTCGVDFTPKGPDLSLYHTPPTPQQEDYDMVFPLECRINGYDLSYIWANDAEVKEALGVREGSVDRWNLCPGERLPNYRTDVRSTIPYHRNLTQRGYRALVYNGDHDLLVPIQGTQAWIRSLGYPVVAPWRPWYDSYDEVAGFTTQYAYNLTFATVKGAGHMAPESRPKECLHMLRKWISPQAML